MTVHIFVAIDSPRCENYALKLVVSDNLNEFDPATVEVILK